MFYPSRILKGRNHNFDIEIKTFNSKMENDINPESEKRMVIFILKAKWTSDKTGRSSRVDGFGGAILVVKLMIFRVGFTIGKLVMWPKS